MMKFILDSVFFGFGFWSLLYVFIGKKDKPLASFSIPDLDRSASFLLFFTGLTYFILFPLIEGGDIDFYQGETAYGYSVSWNFFVQVFYHISCIILLFKPIRENRILRFFIGIFFLIPIEWLVVFISSFYQDFLPSYIPITFEMFFLLPLKGVVFSILLLLLHRLRNLKS